MPSTFTLILPDALAAEVARELRQRQKEEPDLTEAQLIHQHALQYWAMRARETAQAEAAVVNELADAYRAAPEKAKTEARRALGLSVPAVAAGQRQNP
ncbi:MAG: hypothetical protein AB7I50_00475 [Vicinamibacterales bacterium]